MALYVVEESRNGRKRVYRGGQLTPYEKRRPQAHGYATVRAARAAAERLNLQIAFDIYDHRAIEGEYVQQAAYKRFEVIEGGKQRQIYSPDFMAGVRYVRRWQRQQELKRRAHRLEYVKQRIGGAVAVLFGVISVPLLDMDATVALFIIPLGLYAIFTRQLLSEYDESEGGV